MTRGESRLLSGGHSMPSRRGGTKEAELSQVEEDQTEDRERYEEEQE